MSLRIATGRRIDGHLEVDGNLPFAFRATPHVLLNPIRYRFGNSATSLLEIKIDRQSSLVASVLLVMYDRSVECKGPPYFGTLTRDRDVPMIDSMNGQPISNETPAVLMTQQTSPCIGTATRASCG